MGNFPGFVIPFINLLFFIAYSTSIKRKVTISTLTCVALGLGWGIPIGFFQLGAAGVDAVGAILVVLSVFFWVSPLPALFTAFRELDASRVPVLLSCVQVGQSVTWMIAGTLLEDKFIVGCNIGGLLSALLQLSIFASIQIRLRVKKGGVEGKSAMDAESPVCTPTAAATLPLPAIAAPFTAELTEVAAQA